MAKCFSAVHKRVSGLCYRSKNEIHSFSFRGEGRKDIIFACLNKILYMFSCFIKFAMLLLLNSLTYFPTVVKHQEGILLLCPRCS